jgi:hypothetical protein
MSAWSPTTEGFRTIFRRPSLSLAEISWRWSFGAAASMLATFALLEYLDSLPVSNRDLFLLRSGAPSFIGRALAHILRGTGFRFLLAAFVAGIGLALIWIVIASLGRAATLPSLLESIRARSRLVARENVVAELEQPVSTTPSHPVRSLAGLHFLRVLVFGFAVFAIAGAAMAASLLSPTADPHPGVAFLAFTLLAALVIFIVSALNWLLSLAALFVVRDGQDSFGAISSAMDLCRDRLGAVFAVGSWFGLAHLTFFMIASSVVGFPLSLLGIVPPGYALLGVLLVTLLYLAIADSLYIGRLAGYAAILEAPAIPPPIPVALPVFGAASGFAAAEFAAHGLAAPTHAGALPDVEPGVEALARVDQAELILSDVAESSHELSSTKEETRLTNDTRPASSSPAPDEQEPQAGGS